MKRSLSHYHHPLPSPAVGSGGGGVYAACVRSTLASVIIKVGKEGASSLQNTLTSEPLDCASLGTSLKRVKISKSCPGEIRLTRDLEHLAERGWQMEESTKTDFNHVPMVTSSSDEWEWMQSPNRLVWIARDPVDPLRLHLVVLVAHDDDDGGQRRPSETWSFWMQFPRMYPHSPPVVYRLLWNGCVGGHLEESQYLHEHQQQQMRIRVRQVVASSSSTFQMSDTLNSLPAYQSFADFCSHSCNEDNGCNDAEENNGYVAVYQYDEWSPVRRLEDLVHWLVALANSVIGKESENGKGPKNFEDVEGGGDEDALMQGSSSRNSSVYEHEQKRCVAMMGTVPPPQSPHVFDWNGVRADERKVLTYSRRPIGELTVDTCVGIEEDFLMHDDREEEEGGATVIATTPGRKHSVIFHPNRFHVGFPAHKKQTQRCGFSFDEY